MSDQTPQASVREKLELALAENATGGYRLTVSNLLREALALLPAQPEPQGVREAWPYLLQTIAVSDHLGDAADALRSFAAVVGLPQPPDESFEDWHEQIKAEHGVEDGISTFRARLAKKVTP